MRQTIYRNTEKPPTTFPLVEDQQELFVPIGSIVEHPGGWKEIAETEEPGGLAVKLGQIVGDTIKAFDSQGCLLFRVKFRWLSDFRYSYERRLEIIADSAAKFSRWMKAGPTPGHFQIPEPNRLYDLLTSIFMLAGGSDHFIAGNRESLEKGLAISITEETPADRDAQRRTGI